jgi:hypothetical protein
MAATREHAPVDRYLSAPAMTAYILLLTLAPGAGACPSAEDRPIQVTIVVVLATDKDMVIDEKVKEIAAVAREKDRKLTGFKHVNTICESIKMGGSIKPKVVENATCEVTVNAKTDDEGRVTLTVKPPKVDQITYSCTCGKFLPILTDYYTADKKRLIIAIMARPCKKSK